MADPSQAPRLTVINGPLSGTSYEIEPVDDVLIGSDPSCQLFVELDSVSPIHARVWLDAEGVTVFDTHSPRGVFVNGDRVTQKAPLRDGDILWLGPPGEEPSVMIQCHLPMARVVPTIPVAFANVEEDAEPALPADEEEPLAIAFPEASEPAELGEPGSAARVEAPPTQAPAPAEPAAPGLEAPWGEPAPSEEESAFEVVEDPPAPAPWSADEPLVIDEPFAEPASPEQAFFTGGPGPAFDPVRAGPPAVARPAPEQLPADGFAGLLDLEPRLGEEPAPSQPPKPAAGPLPASLAALPPIPELPPPRPSGPPAPPPAALPPPIPEPAALPPPRPAGPPAPPPAALPPPIPEPAALPPPRPAAAIPPPRPAPAASPPPNAAAEPPPARATPPRPDAAPSKPAPAPPLARSVAPAPAAPRPAPAASTSSTGLYVGVALVFLALGVAAGWYFLAGPGAAPAPAPPSSAPPVAAVTPPVPGAASLSQGGASQPGTGAAQPEPIVEAVPAASPPPVPASEAPAAPTPTTRPAGAPPASRQVAANPPLQPKPAVAPPANATPPALQAEAAKAPQLAGQVSNLLAEADSALAARKLDQAAQAFDAVLKLQPNNARAVAGKAAIAIAKKTFVGGTPAFHGRAKKGPAGFGDSEPADPDYNGTVQLQISAGFARPGETVTTTISLVNEGRKAIKIRGMTVKTIVNGTRNSSSAPVLAKEVAPRQTVVLGQAATLWSDTVKSWALEVVVFSERGETYTNSVSWR